MKEDNNRSPARTQHKDYVNRPQKPRPYPQKAKSKPPGAEQKKPAPARQDLPAWPRPASSMRLPVDENVLRMLREAIADEKSDEDYYNKLMWLTNAALEKEILNRIRMDEAKHIFLFEEIYSRITGKKPAVRANIKIIGANIRKEYERAVFEELRSVDFYRKLLFAVKDMEIRDMLYEIITDEQNHAIKLNYLISVQ